MLAMIAIEALGPTIINSVIFFKNCCDDNLKGALGRKYDHSQGEKERDMKVAIMGALHIGYLYLQPPMISERCKISQRSF
jgi:hypothetical protein